MSGNSGRTLTFQRRKSGTNPAPIRRKSGANPAPTETKEDGTEFEDEKIQVDP